MKLCLFEVVACIIFFLPSPVTYGIMLPYSGLFSLGANFPHFPECTHNLGKFILGCFVKFDCELLTELRASVIFLYY